LAFKAFANFAGSPPPADTHAELDVAAATAAAVALALRKALALTEPPDELLSGGAALFLFSAIPQVFGRALVVI
jgi:hypothetical protein